MFKKMKGYKIFQKVMVFMLVVAMLIGTNAGLVLPEYTANAEDAFGVIEDDFYLTWDGKHSGVNWATMSGPGGYTTDTMCIHPLMSTGNSKQPYVAYYNREKGPNSSLTFMQDIVGLNSDQFAKLRYMTTFGLANKVRDTQIAIWEYLYRMRPDMYSRRTSATQKYELTPELMDYWTGAAEADIGYEGRIKVNKGDLVYPGDTANVRLMYDDEPYDLATVSQIGDERLGPFYIDWDDTASTFSPALAQMSYGANKSTTPVFTFDNPELRIVLEDGRAVKEIPLGEKFYVVCRSNTLSSEGANFALPLISKNPIVKSFPEEKMFYSYNSQFQYTTSDTIVEKVEFEINTFFTAISHTVTIEKEVTLYNGTNVDPNPSYEDFKEMEIGDTALFKQTITNTGLETIALGFSVSNYNDGTNYPTWRFNNLSSWVIGSAGYNNYYYVSDNYVDQNGVTTAVFSGEMYLYRNGNYVGLSMLQVSYDRYGGVGVILVEPGEAVVLYVRKPIPAYGVYSNTIDLVAVNSDTIVDSPSASVKVTNKKDRLGIVKMLEDNGYRTAMDGCEFTIEQFDNLDFSGSPSRTETISPSGMSGADFDFDLVYGSSYIISETATPDHFESNIGPKYYVTYTEEDDVRIYTDSGLTNEVDISTVAKTVDASNPDMTTYSLTVVNTPNPDVPRARLQVWKYDEEGYEPSDLIDGSLVGTGASTRWTGAMYGILRCSGADFEDGGEAYGAMLECNKPDENFIDLSPGKYILYEYSAPDGYEIDDTVYWITVDDDGAMSIVNKSTRTGDQVGYISGTQDMKAKIEMSTTDEGNVLGTISAHNKKKEYKFNLVKKNTNGDVLPNIKFTIEGAFGTDYGPIERTTDVNGKISFDSVNVDGIYKISEITVDDVYYDIPDYYIRATDGLMYISGGPDFHGEVRVHPGGYVFVKNDKGEYTNEIVADNLEGIDSDVIACSEVDITVVNIPVVLPSPTPGPTMKPLPTTKPTPEPTSAATPTPEPTYTVTHEFESGTAGKDLPDEVKALLPADITDLKDGDPVAVETSFETSVKVDGGTWTFVEWDKDDLVIDGEDGEFIGKWTYSADPTPTPEPTYKVTHEFESGTAGKDLPPEVLDLLPDDITDLKDGDKIGIDDLPVTEVEVDDGTWTFVEWDKDEVTIGGDDEQVIGKWEFTPKPTVTPTPEYKIVHEFESGTEGKDLPPEVLDLLPSDKTGLADGQVVVVDQLPNTSVKVDGGTWTFVEWDKETITISGTDDAFKGKWVFTPDVNRETVNITGVKRWEHKNNPMANWPTSITINILGNGKIVLSFELTEKEHWMYSYDLPKYDEDGKEIVYTVDEVAVKDYSKNVNGYDITNTFTGSGYVYSDNGDTDTDTIPVPVPDSGYAREYNPKSVPTGDETNLWIWVMTMLGCALILIAVMLVRKSKKISK